MAHRTLVTVLLTIVITINFVSSARLDVDQSQEHRHVSRHIHNEPSNEMRVVSLPLTGRKDTQESAEPQKFEMKPDSGRKEQYLLNFLADMKIGTKVFHDFLSKSNLSEIVEGKQALVC